MAEEELTEAEGREVYDIMARMFVGHPRDDVVCVCKLLHARYRVRRVDGKGCIGTCDFDSWRFNLEVVNGNVTGVHFG